MNFVILFSVIGCGSAAGGIWLMVRIVNRRERWAIRLALVFAAVPVIGYPLSVGPVDWLVHSVDLPDETLTGLETIYFPLAWLYNNGPQAIHDLIDWYFELWH